MVTLLRRFRPSDVSIAVVALVCAAVIAGAVSGGFADLHVYRYAGRAVIDGLPLYESDDPVTGLPFTYPPFAAVMMVPLALLPGWLTAAFWTGAATGCLAAAVLTARREFGHTTSGWLLVPLVVAAFALEPVWQNVSFGQINLILMLAVLVDLLRPERRFSGVLVGLAAAVKLTPLVFVVLLVLVGRRAAAGRAALTFLATVLAGFAVMPRAAASYWTDDLLDGSRVGPPGLAHNQSVYGALTRLGDGAPPTLLWFAVAGPLALAALVVGARWWQRGDRALGTCLAAVAMLIASPVSWSHHWVWAVPVALAVWERSRSAAALWTAVFVARPMLWPPWGDDREYAWGAADHLVGNAYLFAALGLASWAGSTYLRNLHGRHAARSGAD